MVRRAQSPSITATMIYCDLLRYYALQIMSSKYYPRSVRLAIRICYASERPDASSQNPNGAVTVPRDGDVVQNRGRLLPRTQEYEKNVKRINQTDRPMPTTLHAYHKKKEIKKRAGG